MSFHATDAGFSACSARLSKFRKHLMSSVCAGLIIAGAGAGAFGQEQKLPYVQARIKGDREVFRTPEYFANWGLDVHHFDAAYAANATGQGVKLGEFDAGVYVDHPDFYNKTIQGFGKPLIDGTTPEFEKDEKRPEFHGTHVAGTMIANKDGLGMHGGAFGSNDFFTGYFLSYGKLSDKASGDAIIQSGVSFINNSWGPDFDNYRIARQYGVVGPSVSDLGEYNGYRNIRLATEPLLRANPEYSAVILDVIDKALEKQRGRNVDASLAKAAINGVGIVFAAGNDRLYSSSLVLNKFGLRPRLFRGISVGDEDSIAPAYYSGSRDFAALEKNWLTVVNLNRSTEISSYANLCGLAKYYCLGATGGFYDEPKDSKLVQTPLVPDGQEIIKYVASADETYTYSSIPPGFMNSGDYKILSTGVVSTAPQGSTKAEIMAHLAPAYYMANGSSMAAPTVVAGLGVVKSRFPYLENWQVRDTILSTATDLGAPGIDRVYGWGAMNIEKAIGGPSKLFALKSDYDLYEIEKRAAAKYDPIVAEADKYADKAYKQYLKAKELREAGDIAGANAMTAQGDANAKIAFSKELTRVQPNEAQDTEEAAFKYIDFRVNIPGAMSENCPREECIADAWTNDIDGPGGLTKLGKGALALAGTNSYKGETTIDEGVLQLGLGGTTGSVTGNIVNNGTLAYYRSNEWVMRDQISGSGNLEVSAGTLRLAGTNTYSGETSINGGLLAVDGSIASIVSVNAGGELGGIGTVGSLAVHAGGMVSPGNSIGTLHVAGPANFDKATGLTMQVAADGRSDRLDVKGKATLLGGVLIVAPESSKAPLSPAETLALLGKTYTVLTAEKGITGRFEAATPDYYFIGASLAYAQSDVKVSLGRNGIAFADAGKTENQKAAATGVESLGHGNPLYDTIAVTTLGDNLPEHFDALSGEVHASLQAVLVEDSRFVRDAAANRIRAAFGNMAGGKAAAAPVLAYGPDAKKGAAGDAFVPLLPAVPTTALWGEAYGSRSHADRTSNASAYSRNTGGFVTGFDGVIADTWRFGLLAGYGNTSVHTDRGRASADSYQVGVYGGTRIDALTLSLGTSLAHHEIDTRRKVVFGGINDSNTADYTANTVQLFGEAAYRIDTAYAALEPFAAAAYTHLKTAGFTEIGGTTALSGSSGTTDLTTTTLGLRASHRFALSEATVLTAHGMAGWRHAFGDTTPEASLAFASGGQAFAVSGSPIASDTALVEAGLDFGIGKATTLGISYTGQFSQQTRDNAVKADLTVRF